MSRRSQYYSQRDMEQCAADNHSCAFYYPRDWFNTRNVNPEIWGPYHWKYLHTMSIQYPVHPSMYQQTLMVEYIQSLPARLPCTGCRTHAAEYINSHMDEVQYAAQSRETLFKFFVDFHNQVNKRTNKPVITYDTAYKLWTETDTTGLFPVATLTPFS